MVSGAERRLSLRSGQITSQGAEALEPLPDPTQLAQASDFERHQVLGALRLELYAVASIIADGTVRRALGAAPCLPALRAPSVDALRVEDAGG
jgi:hypothetical protein